MRLVLPAIDVCMEYLPKFLPEGSCSIVLFHCLLAKANLVDGETNSFKGKGLAGEHTLGFHAHRHQLHSAEAASLHSFFEVFKPQDRAPTDRNNLVLSKDYARTSPYFDGNQEPIQDIQTNPLERTWQLRSGPRRL